MEKVLRPDKLELDINTSINGKNANKFNHWKTTMDHFMDSLAATANTEELKYRVLINYISPDIFPHVSNLNHYGQAIEALQSLFVKTKNANYARHCLASRKQHDGESVEHYLMELNTLSKDCDFKAVNAEQHCNESIRTAFIAGLKSNHIRQRLLEETKTLAETTKSAVTFEQALRESEHYNSTSAGHLAASTPFVPELAHFDGISSVKSVIQGSEPNYVAAMYNNPPKIDNRSSCPNCGYGQHARRNCPARDANCNSCSRKGHFSRVCRSSKRGNYNSITKPHSAAVPSVVQSAEQPSTSSYNDYLHAPTYTPHLAAINHYPPTLHQSVVNVKVNNSINANLLIDTGSSGSFISKCFVDKLGVVVHERNDTITLASGNHVSKTLGACKVNITLNNHNLENVHLLVIDKLCCDIIIGHDVLCKHEKLTIQFNGPSPPIELPSSSSSNTLCLLSKANIDPPPLFDNVQDDIRPITCSSRKFSEPEQEFIQKTVDTLLAEGTVRPSNSPWRAQVLVVDLNKPHTKPRMVVDYSRTINRFTLLDAYPLPNLDSVISRVARFKVFSSFDLKSAYYQIPIQENEKHYTAFEAAGKLLEFNVIPFGVKNGVAAFQRVIDGIIEKEGLQGTFAYLDNIIAAGKTQDEHDKNVENFLRVVEKYGLTLNESKTIKSVTSIQTMGYLVSENTIKPDPERMAPLLNLPIPNDSGSLKRALGLFSYYSRWVDRFSDRIHSLVGSPVFPLSQECIDAFEDIKKTIADSCIVCPSDNEVLVLESDASDYALSASLNQGGKPVAFFSRTLKPHERKHPAVEKEACAIVEACKKWNHYLAGKKFLLITDQQAVSFMFSSQNHGKIKNDKIQRWRIELSSLDFDIRYRPGPENVTADCLSRAYCSAVSQYPKLSQIHSDLCHPGIVRLYHFVRSKNMPYSIDDVKRVTAECIHCAKIKPQFIRPINPPLIEATKPFDRLSCDFKGPLPSVSCNRYLFVVVDEYSRFPFAFACPDMESSTVIKRLSEIFSIFGTAGYTHSDNGPSLISHELRNFFLDHNIGYSNSTKYNPQGNGQVERYNGVIWKSIQLALASKNLPLTQWELVIPEVLHSQRTLLCTATNQTPHERLFSFQRRSASGSSVPSWLLEQQKVLVKRHARKTKYEPLCDEADLIAVNPTHAKVKYNSGREDTVSLRHLAPLPVVGTDASNDFPSGSTVMVKAKDSKPQNPIQPPSCVPISEATSEPDLAKPTKVENQSSPIVLRRSGRETRPPDFYQAG